MKKYWIAAISKDHIQRGVNGGFIQVSHGKRSPLARAHQGDGVIVYSAKSTIAGKSDCQAFTAIGFFPDDDLYAGEMAPGFTPFRRKVTYLPSRETALPQLIEQLAFIKNKKYWGYPFRFGFFEIGEEDFDLIRKLMTDHASAS